jgi:hypothetical protein
VDPAPRPASSETSASARLLATSLKAPDARIWRGARLSQRPARHLPSRSRGCPPADSLGVAAVCPEATAPACGLGLAPAAACSPGPAARSQPGHAGEGAASVALRIALLRTVIRACRPVRRGDRRRCDGSGSSGTAAVASFPLRAGVLHIKRRRRHAASRLRAPNSGLGGERYHGEVVDVCDVGGACGRVDGDRIRVVTNGVLSWCLAAAALLRGVAGVAVDD